MRAENPAAPTLAEASRAVAAIVGGQSADEALSPVDSSPRRSAVRAVALGTVRWYLRLQPAVDALVARPRSLDRLVHALLVAAAHQIEYSGIAPHHTVHAAVDAARLLRQRHAAGLVNAVLRRFLTERQEILARIDREPSGRTAHPHWLVEACAAAWPSHLGALLAANNAHPPMTLRVNRMRRVPEQYLADLAAAGLGGRRVEWGGESAAVTLERPVPVAELPGFREGWVSVQDAGAQLAAPLLDASAGMRVLDACAAPGGKAAHLLELTGGAAELWAVDADARRLGRVAETLARLGLTAHLAAADVRHPASFWDGRPFDRILVDAPCSGTGVIRRHPDIKLLRRSSDVPAFAAAQLEILQSAIGMLAPGGRLVYATCSVLPQENEAVVERLLATRRGVRAMPLGAERLPAGAVSCRHGGQLLPGGAADTDGFYYACLEKTTPGT